jgi:hypothetical protein
MDADLKKLKKLTKFCRDNGITSVKLAGIEMSLSPASLFPGDEHKHSPETSLISDAATGADLSPEEQQEQALSTLLWSAPGFSAPEVQ